METTPKNKHIIDAAFVICLMFLFVLSALAVITVGANIYKKNVDSMDDNYCRRVACAYITEKTRQHDENGAIYTQKFFGNDALVMQKEYEGVLYNTYIYQYDGNLMELYARDDIGNVYPQSGQKIISVSSFDITEKSDSLFEVKITLKDGDSETFYITKRSTKGR